MDPVLKSLMTQKINVARVASYSASGTEVLSTPEEISAYVEILRQIQGTNGGEEEKTTHLIITEKEITIDDRVWLPGLDPSDPAKSRQPKIVGSFSDICGGLDHYEVLI